MSESFLMQRCDTNVIQWFRKTSLIQKSTLLTCAFFYAAECLPSHELISCTLSILLLVPSPVKGLQADSNHTMHSLAVSWNAPVGVFDRYSVQLSDEDEATVGDVTVPAGITHYLFEGLVPGRIYTVHLKTFSNTSHSKDVIAKGQTRKTRLEERDLTFRLCTFST